VTPEHFAPFDERLRTDRTQGARERSVYVLVDPRDSTVRYVGSTSNPQAREKSHRLVSGACNPLMREWIRELRSLDLAPHLVVIDIDEKRYSRREERWILTLRRRGRLYNRAHNSAVAAAREEIYGICQPPRALY
jgi:hypothetical protein